MSSKRDLLLVRLACRKRWLTAEQGEECIALSRRLGAKRSMEEIFRLKGYLESDQLRELFRAADQTDRRRGADPRRAESRGRSVVEESPTLLHAPADATILGPLPDATILGSLPDATILGPLPDEQTVYMRRPVFDAPTEFGEAVVPRALDSSDAPDQTLHDAGPRGVDPDRTMAHQVVRLPSTLYMPAADPQIADDATALYVPPAFDPAAAPRRIDVDRRGPSVPEGEQQEALLGSFGNYELEAVLARGAQAVVYRARLVNGGVPVALRVLDLDFTVAAQYVADRAEGLVAAARLDNSRIARLLDVGHAEGRHYVATELVDGFTLEELIWTDSAPSGPDALRVLDDVAEGLLAAHREGVAHGSLDPGRILIEDGPRARLYGFGLSVHSDPVSDARAFVGVAEALLEQAPEPFAHWAAKYRGAVYPDLLRMKTELLDLGRRPVRWERSAAPVGLSLLATRALAWGTGATAGLSLVHRFVLPSTWTVQSAFLGAAGLVVATVLLGALALIRRGELPLPVSTAWLVRVEESASLSGAALVAGGVGIVPLAGVHVVAAVVALVCVASRTFGVLLRRVIASRRADGGRGRMLAVLADPLLMSWRVGHTPWLVLATALALTRFLLLAYFSAG